MSFNNTAEMYKIPQSFSKIQTCDMFSVCRVLASKVPELLNKLCEFTFELVTQAKQVHSLTFTSGTRQTQVDMCIDSARMMTV